MARLEVPKTGRIQAKCRNETFFFFHFGARSFVVIGHKEGRENPLYSEIETR